MSKVLWRSTELLESRIDLLYPDGLSWTENLSTAIWFASRFNTDKDKGYIQKAVIDKSRALAYFNTRDEDELVVDTTGLQYEILEIDLVVEEE